MWNAIDSIIKKYMVAGYFPGAVCKVSVRGEMIYEKSFGYGSLEPVLVPANEKMVFDAASLTKIVTSTVALMLITDNKMKLEDPVLNYFAEAADYPALAERLKDVTVKNLLTHSSGLIDWYPFYSEKGDFLQVLNEITGRTEKVKGVLYSDLNFMLLGEMIKRITGMGLDEALEQYIRIPLGIDNMNYCPKDKLNIACTEFGNRIEKSMCKDRNISFDGWRTENLPICGEVNDGNAFYYFGGMSGHAGIFSDADGFTNICQLYLTGGEWKSKRLIEERLVKEAMKEQKDGRGLGWQISEIFPQGCGHSGFTGTSLWLCPEMDIAAVTLTNRLHTRQPRNLQPFRQELHEAILNQLK